MRPKDPQDDWPEFVGSDNDLRDRSYWDARYFEEEGVWPEENLERAADYTEQIGDRIFDGKPRWLHEAFDP